MNSNSFFKSTLLLVFITTLSLMGMQDPNTLQQALQGLSLEPKSFQQTFHQLNKTPSLKKDTAQAKQNLLDYIDHCEEFLVDATNARQQTKVVIISKKAQEVEQYLNRGAVTGKKLFPDAHNN